MSTVHIKYIGTALPTSGSTVNLFSSVVSFNYGGQIQAMGWERCLIDIVCSHDCTLKWYKSNDHGTNWFQVGSQALTGASGTEATNAPMDILIEPFLDFKVDALIGGTTMTTFQPDISLTTDRAQG